MVFPVILTGSKVPREAGLRGARSPLHCRPLTFWCSMDPLTGGLLAGGANLLGSIFSSSTSASNTEGQIAAQQAMQRDTQQFNAQQAQVQRDYQTQMSNTAYQRASSDMKSAGLNPMMMFGSGGPSSTPPGASASTSVPSVPSFQKTNPLAGIGDAVSKAVSSAVSMQTFDKMTQEIANLRTQQAKTAAETVTEKERAPLVHEQTFRTANESARMQNLMPTTRLAGKSAEDILALPDWLRQSLNVGGFAGDKVSDVLKPILNSASGYKRLLSSPGNPTKSYSGLGPSGTNTVKEMIDDALKQFDR
jgi:hypothetical protein